MRDLITQSARRLLETHLPEVAVRQSRTGRLPDGWQAMTKSGLLLALRPDSGIGRADALALAEVAGAHASPGPIAETMLANWLLGLAGLPPATGPATVAVLAGAAINDGQLTGRAAGVPWAMPGVEIIAIGGGALVRSWAPALLAEPSISGLPRASVTVAASVAAKAPEVDIQAAMAALRTHEIAGALATILAMTTEWTGTRVQFGKPLSRNQAVQHGLARLASESAAAGAAASLAASGFGRADARLTIAAAKARASEAAGIGAGIAHQLHGAIGFTADHRLHLFTRALWQWRDDAGNEHDWAAELGAAALAAPAYWPMVTAL